MNTYRLFALPSHTFKDRVSGVDFVRIIQPMKYLDGYTTDDARFEVTTYNPKTDPDVDWRDVMENYDGVYLNYTSNDWGYAMLGCLAQKYKRKIICDFDDDLWNILQDNTAYEVYKDGSWGRKVVTAIAGDVHHVTVTNQHLKNSLIHNTKKSADQVSVLPNYVDLSVYNHISTFKDRGYYKALHFGSSSHFNSLYSEVFYGAMDRIMQEFPNFSFTTVGAFVPKYRQKWGMRYSQDFGHTDVLEWIQKMPSFMDDTDLLLVPLNDNIYNRSKSSIKFLEASSYKIPGCYQNIRQYQEVVEHGKNGFLCTTEDEWYTAIKTMLTNARLRKAMGENAYKTIHSNWTIQKHVDRYAEMVKKVLDSE